MLIETNKQTRTLISRRAAFHRTKYYCEFQLVESWHLKKEYPSEFQRKGLDYIFRVAVQIATVDSKEGAQGTKHMRNSIA